MRTTAKKIIKNTKDATQAKICLSLQIVQIKNQSEGVLDEVGKIES